MESARFCALLGVLAILVTNVVPNAAARLKKRVMATSDLLATRASNLANNASDSAYFKDCASLTEAEAVSIYKQFDGGSVTVDGVRMGNLECVGAGGFGLVFAGLLQEKDVIVKLFFNGKTDDVAFKWAETIQDQAIKNRGVTGNSCFMAAIKDGMTTEDNNLYVQVWERAPGYNLAQIEGPLQLDSNYDLIGSGHDNKKYGFDKAFGMDSLKTARIAYLAFIKKVLEGIIFLWSLGLKHKDIQGSNVMWDGRTETLTFIDYDMMADDQARDKANPDVADAKSMFLNFRGAKGKKAKDLEEDFEKNGSDIQKSLDKFVAFYQRHFADPVVKATRL